MKQWEKRIRKLHNSNDMVSEVIGTILLLGIAVTIFSALYVVVLSPPDIAPMSSATVVGTVEGSDIILEHRGGETLGLDAEIPLSIEGTPMLINGHTPTVGDLLEDSNGDGKWNIGERLRYPFNYDSANEKAEVQAIDMESNSIVLSGTLNIQPECDLGVEITVDNLTPEINTDVVFTITVNHYHGDINATNVKVNFKLPDGLEYLSHTSGENYDHNTGIWNVGTLVIGESVSIDITAEVVALGHTTPTQLAILLDGSGSIDSADWTLMLDGLSDALRQSNCIPHDGSVELTVIQFGGWHDELSWAEIEVSPVVLDETNYANMASIIENIGQLGGGTAMSCAFNLAADVLSGDPNGYLVGTDWDGMASSNFDTFNRCVINVVTDGEPNILCTEGEYSGTWPGSYANPDEFTQGKANTVLAKNYLDTLLGIGDDDEIDSEAVGPGPDVEWLKDNIASPDGYKAPPFDQGPGWVSHVENYQEFADTIDAQFKLIFNSIKSTVEILISTPQDPNVRNNEVSVIIVPHEPTTT